VLPRFCPVDPGEALGGYLGREFLAQFEVRLRSQFQGRPLLGAQPHAIGNVVLGNNEILARVVLAADDDMTVRMAGIEMIDGDPIELRSKVLCYLAHDVAGEAAKVGKPVAILGRDDEAELMAVLPPALHKLLSICYVGLGPIQTSAFAFPGRSIALQVAQMGVGSLARPFQPDNPRLHHHAAHPLARATLLGGMFQMIGCRLASADTATSPFPGPVPTTPTSPVPPHLRGRQRTAACVCCRLQDLVNKRCRAPP
jgi:hypothetical protein